jgi:DNA modification methylase
VSTIHIGKITIAERQRTDLDSKEFEQHVRDLADSIKRFGLINPITLNKEDNSLVAGFCRIMAHALLKRSEIEYRYVQDLDDVDRKELELEENVRRRQLEWYEEAAAIADIYEMRKARDPEWSMQKTAELVGRSKGSTVEAITVAAALKENPRLKEEKGATSAIRKVQTARSIEKRKREIALVREAKGEELQAQILIGDALALIKTMPDESFDCVVTNFPFGVDLELKSEGRNENLAVYRDDETEITDLVIAMCPEIYRVLKPDSWFVGFFDMHKITHNSFMSRVHNVIREWDMGETDDRVRMMGLTWWLEQAGFSYVSKTPFVWGKPDKSQGIIGNPQKGMIVAYEMGVFASKGDAVLLKQGRNNLFLCNSAQPDKVHPLQMPTELCQELLDMVVLGGGHVLDPFAGSGAFGLAALEKQCRFVGFELDPDLGAKGNLRLQERELGK